MRICLLAHEGLSNRRIAQQLKISRPTVILWRNHFLKDGVAGLEHEPPRKTSSQRTKDDPIKAIVEATLHTIFKFLRQVDRETPEGMDLHLIVDHYATHQHPKVKEWIQRHKRFHPHCIPTSSSGLNLVERWFGEITRKRIRRGVFKGVKELIKAIGNYVETNNQNPGRLFGPSASRKS